MFWDFEIYPVFIIYHLCGSCSERSVIRATSRRGKSQSPPGQGSMLRRFGYDCSFATTWPHQRSTYVLEVMGWQGSIRLIERYNIWSSLKIGYPMIPPAGQSLFCPTLCTPLAWLMIAILHLASRYVHSASRKLMSTNPRSHADPEPRQQSYVSKIVHAGDNALHGYISAGSPLDHLCPNFLAWILSKPNQHLYMKATQRTES